MTSEANPQRAARALTRAQYDKLTPFEKGYATYMQAEWNKAVPKACEYEDGSKQRKEFERGEFAAVLEAQDGDDS
jgi:hypothetical protein